MMAQPPYDEKMDPFYILHYTYGEAAARRHHSTPHTKCSWVLLVPTGVCSAI